MSILDDFVAGPPTSIKPLGYGGIDPGLTGFMTAVSADPDGPRVLLAERCPTIKDAKGKPVAFDRLGMYAAACRLRAVTTFTLIEKQQVMPGNGANGNFTTGFGYALWLLALDLAGVKYRELAPVTWKAAMEIMPSRLKGAGKLPKEVREARRKANREEGAERAIALASTLFVGFDAFDLRPTPESDPSPDKAVALLLAALARRTHEAASRGHDHGVRGDRIAVLGGSKPSRRGQHRGS